MNPSGTSTPFDPQAPREVTEQVIASIAEALASEGFVHKRSTRKLVKVEGAFEFAIWFQANRYNSKGSSVTLTIYALASSKAFKRWKDAVQWPLDSSDAVGGGQLGNLGSEPKWLTWDFVDPHIRPAQIADAMARIRSSALAFFDVCANRSALLASLSDGRELLVFGIRAMNKMALALWLNDRDLAIKLGKRVIVDGDLVQVYADASANRILPLDLSPQVATDVQDLVAVARAFELPLDG